MPTVKMVGWKEGLQKIALTNLIKSDAGIGLKEAKKCTDDLVEGKTVYLKGLSAEAATHFLNEASLIGAVCEIIDD